MMHVHLIFVTKVSEKNNISQLKKPYGENIFAHQVILLVAVGGTSISVIRQYIEQQQTLTN